MSLKIVKVDWNGVDAGGEDFHFFASPEPVALGYMVNVPTLIQYPDGKLAEGNQVKITPRGLEYFKREVPLEIRDTEGAA